MGFRVTTGAKGALGRLLLCTMLAGPLAVTGVTGLAPVMAQGTENALHFDIPAQSLASALNAFGRQSGLQVTLAASAARGVTSKPVQGTYTPAQALQILLAGSGISARITADGTALIGQTGGGGEDAGDGSTSLGTILLDGSLTTEGSNSYTTGATASSTGLPLSIRETPQSVSVVTEKRMKDQGLRTTQEVLAYTTGVVSSTFETDRDSTYARGGWVGTYVIDGTVIDSQNGFYAGTGLHSSTATMDRVEVVRGSTGLLTGAGDPTAAVRIERKKANRTEFGGSTELRFGTWNQVGGTLDIGSALTKDGRVRARFIADIASEESYIDRYSVEKQTYYATIAADLTDQTMLTFSAEHRNHDPRGSQWGVFPAWFSDGTRTDFGQGFSNGTDWTHWATEQSTADLRLDHSFDNGWKADATLSAVTRKYDAELVYFSGDLDRATGLGLTPGFWKGKSWTRQISLNASLNGPIELFGREHKLNFGISGSRGWTRYDGYTFDGTGPTMGSIYDWGPIARPDWYQASNGDWAMDVTQYAGFASGQFRLTEDLSMVAGLRYTDWASGDRNFRNATPYLGFVYDLNDTYSVYASYTEIFSPQGVKDRNGAYLDPVLGKSEEIGGKAEFYDGRLNASLTLFRSYRDNVATADTGYFVPGTGNQAYYGSKGIEAKGLEFEVAGEIRPGWNIFVGAARTKTTNASGAKVNGWLPEDTIRLFSTWQLEGDLSAWTIGGGLRWQSQTWADLSFGGVSTRKTAPSFTLVDLMLRYDLSESWSAQLSVNNLLDEVYYNSANIDSQYGEPRNAMLTLTSRF